MECVKAPETKPQVKGWVPDARRVSCDERRSEKPHSQAPAGMAEPRAIEHRRGGDTRDPPRACWLASAHDERHLDVSNGDRDRTSGRARDREMPLTPPGRPTQPHSLVADEAPAYICGLQRTPAPFKSSTVHLSACMCVLSVGEVNRSSLRHNDVRRNSSTMSPYVA